VQRLAKAEDESQEVYKQYRRKRYGDGSPHAGKLDCGVKVFFAGCSLQSLKVFAARVDSPQLYILAVYAYAR